MRIIGRITIEVVMLASIVAGMATVVFLLWGIRP
jgi:hypothetical protein